ncbi:unnamed protein product, partial [Brassica oleracea var. botrytis]
NHEPITTPDPESGTNPYPTKRLKHLKSATQDYESLHPTETKVGDGGAEEAPTSRRLGRRRRSWISLHLPDSKTDKPTSPRQNPPHDRVVIPAA